jgi:nucleoside-diphosphate-sugar epimerase
MRRVLVTGGTGYIGTRLVASLRAAGDDVTVLRRSNGQLPDLDGWTRALDGIDAVVHLAAQTSAYVSDRDPVADAQANVLPVLALLEACARGATRTVVLAGTATVFGLPAQVPVADDAVARPVTVYDLHKRLAEQYLDLYARMRAIRGAALRLCNVYGPGPAGSPDRGIINMMVKRATDGKALTVYGTGELVRDYVYIDDVVEAFRLAIDHAGTLAGGAYLIGSGVGTRIVDAMQLVAQTAAIKLGKAPDVTHVPEPDDQSPIEKRNFIADTTAFRTKTGWRAQVAFPDGIARTFDAVLGHG